MRNPARSNSLRRRSTRLQHYDYRQPGAYFFTVCTLGRQCWLGEIKKDEFVPSTSGEIVLSTWDSLSERYPAVSADAFVVMPNHIHGVIIISTPDDTNVGVQFIAPDPKNQGVINHAPTLGECVRVFKAVSTRFIHQAGLNAFGWQRNYYEHIVRDDAELGRIRKYILENPFRWALDEENPAIQKSSGLLASTLPNSFARDLNNSAE